MASKRRTRTVTTASTETESGCLAQGADGEATLASINEAVAASFPGASVTVEREYRNALRGYALRVPAGSLETIRAVGGVQAAYPDGNNSLQ